MPRCNILVAESAGFTPEAARILASAGRLYRGDLNRAQLLRQVLQADVLWVRLGHRIDRELFEKARRLRAIATPATGLNHLDLEEAARRGVHVLSLRGETDFLRDVRATAEHTIALAFALLRQVVPAARHVEAGGWERNRFRGVEIYGKTVGIVGYGRLGRIVARYFAALGATVVAADPHVSPAEVDLPVRLVALAELVASADIVSVHVLLTPETTGLLGREAFARMKPGAYFINTARGELIDEAALLGALTSGRLAGAAVDVLSNEHEHATSPLVTYARGNPARLLITPHLGGCTHESMAKTEVFLARRVAEFLAAERRSEVLPVEASYKSLGNGCESSGAAGEPVMNATPKETIVCAE
jgi:D-3-phosphoglycerate dehydrogenase / 2-oxoglutarate reductase